MVPTINHWIGQEEAIRRFRVALEASWNDGTRLPHMLFVGGPGLGKTELAHVAAKEMGVALHERLAQVIDGPEALNRLLAGANDKEIVFLDEIHELDSQVQTVLYRAMEGGTIYLQKYDKSTMAMPLKDITVIGATTDEFRLLSPLRDRFRVVLPFMEYDSESLAKITLQHAQSREIAIEEAVGIEIARRSKGTPRLAIRLLESCHRYVRSRGQSRITQRHFGATVELDGLDELGLGPDEQRYLRFLARRDGKPVRLITIESALGIHRRTIQSVIEPFLVRSGLVERHSQGRVITEAGLQHLGFLIEPKISIT